MNGCTFRYYDQQTGTEHLFGFGHMKLKVNVATNNLTSVVTGTQMLGAHVGVGPGFQAGLGWDNTRRILVMTNSAVLYEWPSLGSSFFTVRISSNLPPDWSEFKDPETTQR